VLRYRLQRGLLHFAGRVDAAARLAAIREVQHRTQRLWLHGSQRGAHTRHHRQPHTGRSLAQRIRIPQLQQAGAQHTLPAQLGGAGGATEH
jgi:hypothetical protein